MAEAEESERVQKLAPTLENVWQVSQYALDGEPGGWRVAYSIVEIDRSARKLVERLVPAIEAEHDSEKLEELLHEYGEEMRHILYHVADSGIFSYLFESVRDTSEHCER